MVPGLVAPTTALPFTLPRAWLAGSALRAWVDVAAWNPGSDILFVNGYRPGDYEN
jgi:hypothetical protein